MWDKKKKFRIPIRSQSSDLQISCFDAEFFTIPLFNNYKHDPIDTTDSSSMKNTYELYEPLSSLSLSGSEGEHQGMESEGLRFDSSWGLRLFTLSHTCDKMINIFFYHKNCMTDSKENY